MNSSIYIDPNIDLQSEEYIEVIMQFKTKPAKVAVAEGNSNLTLEQAKQQIDTSHALFRQELEIYLELKQIQYFITYVYKDALNGVCMELQACQIKALLQSKVIGAIYANPTIPIKPNDPMYQL